MESIFLSKGSHHAEMTIPKLSLSPGSYIIGVYCSVGKSVADYIEYAVHFTVHDDDYYGTGRMIGGNLTGKVVLCDHKWDIF